MTRLGQISPLWAIFGIFNIGFGKLLYVLGQFFSTGQILIAVNGQRLKDNFSHLVTLPLTESAKRKTGATTSIAQRRQESKEKFHFNFCGCLFFVKMILRHRLVLIRRDFETSKKKKFNNFQKTIFCPFDLLSKLRLLTLLKIKG